VSPITKMTCSICFERGHNKRTCPHASKTPCKDTPTASEVRVAGVLGATLSLGTQYRKCSICGEHGHNKRTCPHKRLCSLCGVHGHNKLTCPLIEIEKENVGNVNHRKCSVCGAHDHNKRTCTMKCIPCSDQVARGYCFSGMSDKMAVKIAKVMDCKSIYGESEEYPQFEQTIDLGTT